MGQEISETHFRQDEFRRFQERLHDETQVLLEWISNDQLSDRDFVSGLELELCLVDSRGEPSPNNQFVIDSVASPNVVPELSQFNLEFNVEPTSPRRQGLIDLQHRMDSLWMQCQAVAKGRELSVLSIGILPTLSDDHMNLLNMSPLHRYRALNEQVLRMRKGKPVRLDIHGFERLSSEHLDVMLEAATTSFQLHLQVPQSLAAKAYNTSLVLSAPMVALTANSPLLFGKRLWHESRIPLFEQAVATESPVSRVTFGTGYVERDLGSLLIENERLYPVLLPLNCDSPKEKLAHLRMHNGTIWRWNRPIVGFDDGGRPHFRIEHRVMAAGPTSIDMLAQMAFFYGLMAYFLEVDHDSFEDRLPFIGAWSNFYEAARNGLNSHIPWIDGKKWPIAKLILDVLLPQAEIGFQRLEIDSSTFRPWLDLLHERATTGQNGAQWQMDFFECSGRDTALLVREYRTRQESGEPIHLWTL